MKIILTLIKKDLTVDWRQQNPIMGILLYLASTIFITYMVFKGFVSVEVWNALYWIILLFVAINAISKTFEQEEKRIQYYFHLCKASDLIIAKLIYSFLYLMTLAIISLMIYVVLFGNPIPRMGLFLMNLTLGCLGISSAFTMVSAIALKGANRSVMMAVLGFPVIIPVLVLVISNSAKILEGMIWMQIQGNVISLFSLDVIIIALTFVLFPFIWKS